MAEALGWALFHFLWQGAILGVSLAVALCFSRTARVRYLLATGTMAAMIMAFAATLALCWPERMPAPTHTVASPLPAARVLFAPPAPLEALHAPAPPECLSSTSIVCSPGWPPPA
jgi:hypothetical protein